jgi:hypothetical protein
MEAADVDGRTLNLDGIAVELPTMVLEMNVRVAPCQRKRFGVLRDLRRCNQNMEQEATKQTESIQ